jgi:hypothetical protein
MFPSFRRELAVEPLPSSPWDINNKMIYASQQQLLEWFATTPFEAEEEKKFVNHYLTLVNSSYSKPAFKDTFNFLLSATYYKKAASFTEVPSPSKSNLLCLSKKLLDRLITHVTIQKELCKNYKILYGYAFNLRGIVRFEQRNESLLEYINDFARATELGYVAAQGNLGLVYWNESFNCSEHQLQDGFKTNYALSEAFEHFKQILLLPFY